VTIQLLTDLPGCAATGTTREEAEQNMYQAIEMHIMDYEKMGYPSLNQLPLQSMWLSSKKFGNSILIVIHLSMKKVSSVKKLACPLKAKMRRTGDRVMGRQRHSISH